MKQYVVMNSQTGEIGIAVPIQFVDAVQEENELANLQGYSIQVRNKIFDGWLIQPKDNHPFVFCQTEYFDKALEVLGEL